MAATPTPAPNAAPRDHHPLRTFWARVTEGAKLEQLGRQFVSEAKASYGFYSKDVDWDEIDREKSKGKRFALSFWALFHAMLMKLSPARRVLLLLAFVLLLVQPDVHWGKQGRVNFSLAPVGVVILFVLLAVELADRVTMKRDLEIAREIQQWLVPDRPPVVPGFDIAFATRPQNTVAGDYYDAFLRPLSDAAGDPPLFIAVADVAGKSVPAALLMATFQASLRALAATPATLDEIVTGIDRYCRTNSLEGRRFTTAFLAQIDPQTRRMRYTNAGHNDPILRRTSGEIERLSVGGPPFGLPLFSDREVTYGLSSVQLQPGDLLVIFTDGVVEAEDNRGEEFGESRLISLIQSAPPESAAHTLAGVMAQVNTFVGQVRQHDDITCFILRVNG